MRQERIDSGLELQFLTAMVVSKEFLSQVYSVIDVELFKSSPVRRIANWCLQYHEKYHDAPNNQIENIYHAWTESGKASEDERSAVHDLLVILSKKYDQESVNVSYLMDLFGEYFSLRKIESLKDVLDYAVLQKDRGAAEEAIASYKSVDVGVGHGIDPLNDESVWDSAYSEAQQSLLHWGNEDADRFFGGAFTRDALIGILGPEKRGKTMWCVEFAMRALLARRKVALFEVGDMSESQIMKRFAMRLCNRPMYRSDCLQPIKVPTDLVKTEEDGVYVLTKDKKCDAPADAESAKTAVKKFLRQNGIQPNDPHLLISVHPNSSINVAGITSILNKWEVEQGFVPDVVIIDYPDILDCEPSAKQYAQRDQINMTWKALRRLSQEKHCLVIAPTQADAASYTKKTLEMSNFSEDKRKAAHVTGMLGLNQTTEEKEQGVMRLNWIVLREGAYTSDRCLYVAQCLSLGRAFCKAIL